MISSTSCFLTLCFWLVALRLRLTAVKVRTTMTMSELLPCHSTSTSCYTYTSECPFLAFSFYLSLSPLPLKFYSHLMLMAHTSIITTIILLLSSLLITATYSQQFSRDVSQHELGLHKQKLSHLHFYFHDAFGGRHPTVVRVATAASTNTSASSFGALMMIDDPLTIGPKSNSKIVGRAQGIYGFADLKIPGLLMVMNYVFTDGKFNGSTLSVLGRNPVLNTVREMPIVGGSGVFRFARGYAQAKTHRNLPTSTIVEYNVYVFHY